VSKPFHFPLMSVTITHFSASSFIHSARNVNSLRFCFINIDTVLKMSVRTFCTTVVRVPFRSATACSTFSVPHENLLSATRVKRTDVTCTAVDIFRTATAVLKYFVLTVLCHKSLCRSCIVTWQHLSQHSQLPYLLLFLFCVIVLQLWVFVCLRIRADFVNDPALISLRVNVHHRT
jgi:hypothetical protein